LVKEGGRLALEFDGSNDYFDLTGLTASASNYSLHTITKNSAANSFLFDSDSGRLIFDGRGGTRGVYFDGGWKGTMHSGTAQQLQSIYAVSPSSGQSYVDGVQINTGLSYTQTAIGGQTALGSIKNATGFFINGSIQEWILYASDKSTDRTSIEGNISGYYQSAKLLNEAYGSGAAAAYSVRQLNRDYTGAAIQVERSSDNTTQDIGFDSNGDLDESALTTFCTGTTCRVRTWYDQATAGGTGSGNDAVQTTHANQPTIYTGGALVKENGKVAVEFDGSNDILKQSGGILNGLSSYSLFSTFNPLTSATAYEAYLHQAVVTTPFNNTFELRRDDANDRFNPISGQSLPLQNTTASINNSQLLVSMLRNGATTNKIYQIQ
jgi:hypothetical protein